MERALAAADASLAFRQITEVAVAERRFVGKKAVFEMVMRPCAKLPKELRGKLIVVARPAGDDKQWCFIHVPTGYATGRVRFKSQKAAIAALPEVLELTRWEDITVDNANAHSHLEEAIIGIAVKHGGLVL
jgi:hypothetical protein